MNIASLILNMYPIRLLRKKKMIISQEIVDLTEKCIKWLVIQCAYVYNHGRTDMI